MVKYKLCPGQKQPHCTANTTSGLCRHLHKQRASTEPAETYLIYHHVTKRVMSSQA